jgi:hypothetical protein
VSDDTEVIASEASDHSEALFGQRLSRSALQVVPIAQHTRAVYTVRRVDVDAPALIAKLRSFRSDAERHAAEIQTSHEFARLAAVSQALAAAGRPQYSVPRAVLALPQRGLIFMEQVVGEPVQRPLRRWLLMLRSFQDTSAMMRRCGEWLYTFSTLAPPIAWPRMDEDAARILQSGRDRHHVYSLIGPPTADLPAAMQAGITRRLGKWNVPGLAARVEKALGRQFAQVRGDTAQGNLHGKYSIADVFVQGDRVFAVDLEQAGHGSLYLDAAYFLFQVYMVTRWRPFTQGAAADLRAAFLRGRSPSGELDDRLLDCCIGYYMVNSLRPGDGIAGARARAYTGRWIEAWLRRVGV